MKVSLKELRQIIKEKRFNSQATISQKDQTVSNPAKEIFILSQDLLNKLDNLPKNTDYGDFAGEKSILWQADGQLEFVVNIVINTLEEEIKESIRDVVYIAVLDWLHKNHLEVTKGQIHK